MARFASWESVKEVKHESMSSCENEKRATLYVWQQVCPQSTLWPSPSKEKEVVEDGS